MASVFLSYDHDDVARAAPLAAALEKAGHSVWWDRHIHGGAEYNSAIEGAVESADVVVVLWSARAVQSAWVRDEAAEGRDRGKLVPVVLDGTKPPMGFRQYQTIALSEWKARKPPPEIAQLLQAIKTVARPQSERGAATIVEPPKVGSGQPGLRWKAAVAGLVVLTVIGLFLWQPWRTANASTIAISAGDRSSASQNYARDLLAQLGQLQSAKPDSLRLVGPEDRKRAGLVFEVTGTTEAQEAHANVVLLDGRTGDLMWSSAFEEPVARSGDLRQQLGFTAATVLQCTVEAHEDGREALKREVLKQYLNGCAQWAHGAAEQALDLIPVFRRVIVAAPRFEGGWAKLISAESDALAVSGDDYPGIETPRVRQLRADIAAARKINPDLPEAYLAEADLLPLNAFGRKLSLVDRAVAARPDQSRALAFRSSLLFAVGRVTDALDDARHAKNVDPVSPRAREIYIFALAQAGRTEAALQEIEKAERIWPGSTAIAGARFAVNLRFGDPRVAWQMIQAGETGSAWAGAQNFVKARITRDPRDIELAIQEARAAYRRSNGAWGHLVQTLSIFDREDELLDLLMHVPLAEAIWVTDLTFRPAARELWRKPEALRYAQRVGLLSYWQSSGNWPDFCYDSGLPYDCKKEGAKLSPVRT